MTDLKYFTLFFHQGAEILTVVAFDGDRGKPNTVQYSLIDGKWVFIKQLVVIIAVFPTVCSANVLLK